jgi:hypothetical protein
MLGAITMLVLRDKILKIEADRHGFGWNVLPTSMHVVSIDGLGVRSQILPRPPGLALTDPPHVQVAAYTATARTADPRLVTGTPVAATFTAEMCPGCLSSWLPRPVHRVWHRWRHQPRVRVLVAVDTTGTRYYLQRDRADDTDLAYYISPPPQGGDDIAVPLYQAIVELLATWQTRTAGLDIAADDSVVDEPVSCRTPGCDGDPDDGDGWDGFCGTCADRLYEAELNRDTARPSGNGNAYRSDGDVHNG